MQVLATVKLELVDCRNYNNTRTSNSDSTDSWEITA